jgi:hypothetical protein
LPCSDQIFAELIIAGGETLLSATHKLINPIWNKEELQNQWNEYIIGPIHQKPMIQLGGKYHKIFS